MSPIRCLFLSILALFFSSCALKKDSIQKNNFQEIYWLLHEQGLGERIYSGKLFIEGELNFFKNNNHSGASYGIFFVGREQLLLQLTPPFSSETLIYWERSLPEILIINPAQKVVLRVSSKAQRFPEDLPLYFLGLKEEERHWNLGSHSVKYKFYREEKRGEIRSVILNITWTLKELGPAESFPKLPPLDEYKIRSITLPF